MEAAVTPRARPAMLGAVFNVRPHPLSKVFVTGLLLSLLVALPASAHTKLLKSTPAAGSQIKTPPRITLQFSESLEPAFSGALLLDTEGRNMRGAPVEVSGTTITLKPEPLAPGVYRVSWHGVSHDTHRVEGSFRFTVKP